MAVVPLDAAYFGIKVTTPTVTSYSIPVPSAGGSLATGDFLLAHVLIDDNTGVFSTWLMPAGWTTLIPQTATGSAASQMQWAVYYHLVTAGENGTVPSWSMTDSTAHNVGIMVERYRGVNTTTPFASSSPFYGQTLQSSSGTSRTSPSITTTFSNALVVSAAVQRSTTQTMTPSTGWTIFGVIPNDGTYGRQGSSAYQTQSTAGASATCTWTGTGTVAAGGAYIYALNPADSGSTNTVNPTLTSRWTGIPVNGTVPVAVKTVNAASVRLKFAKDPAMTNTVTFGPAVAPSAQSDAKLQISGLTAGTWYYRVGMTPSGGTEVFDTGTIGRVVVPPTGQYSFAFDFGSCTDGTDSASLAAIAARNDDLFFHLGDLYYADGSGTDVPNIRSKFNAKVQATNHAAVLSQTASLYIPSDHEGMNNNSVYGDDNTAWNNWNQVYREQVPAVSLPSNGAYYTFVWGRVRFIALDTRSFKDAISKTDNSSKTALGAVQKQWLKDTITASTEPVIVIIQADPWSGSTDTTDDSWPNYTTERAELGSFFKSSGKNIAMLGGDMHALAADDGTDTVGNIALFQAAPFNNASSVKGGPYTVGPYPSSGSSVVQQYGRVVVTDTGANVSLAFTGYSSDNTQRVALSKTYSATGGTPPPAPTGTPVVLGAYRMASAAATEVASGFSLSDIVNSGLSTLSFNITGLGYPAEPVMQVSPGTTTFSSTRYFSFTITPTASCAFTSITVNSAKGGTGTRGATIRSSVDGYAADLPGWGNTTTTRPNMSSYTVDLTNVGTQSSPVTFRVYPYTSSGTATLEVDDLTVYGITGASQPIVATATVKTLVGGVWTADPVKTLVGGTWTSSKTKVFVKGSWIQQ